MAQKQLQKPKLDDRDHMRDCPGNPEREESYTDRKPDGRLVVITRCIDCGGMTHKEVRE